MIVDAQPQNLDRNFYTSEMQQNYLQNNLALFFICSVDVLLQTYLKISITYKMLLSIFSQIQLHTAQLIKAVVAPMIALLQVGLK